MSCGRKAWGLLGVRVIFPGSLNMNPMGHMSRFVSWLVSTRSAAIFIMSRCLIYQVRRRRWNRNLR